jgi:hypothetical protein
MRRHVVCLLASSNIIETDAMSFVVRIMPAAMVPRPWDFAPSPDEGAIKEKASSTGKPSMSQATDLDSRLSGSPSYSRRSGLNTGIGPSLNHSSSLPPILPEVVISPPNGSARPIFV